jgi:hypothetical protein
MSKYKETIEKVLRGEGYASVCNDWKEWIYGEHPELRPELEFKVGDWVIPKNNEYPPSRATSVGSNELKYGPGQYYTFDYIRKATPEEIEKHLVEEAKRRGYVKGVKARSLFANYEGRLLGPTKWNHYDKHDDQLWMQSNDCNLVIYERGKWAEIIED